MRRPLASEVAKCYQWDKEQFKNNCSFSKSLTLPSPLEVQDGNV